MKRTLSISVVSMVLALLSVFTTSAFAGMNTDYNFPGLSFGYGTYDESNGSLDSHLYLSTAYGRIDNVSVSFSGSGNPLEGWLSFSINGIIDDPIPHTNEWVSDHSNFRFRGFTSDSYMGIGSYQECIGWNEVDDTPILGDWRSSGSISVILSNTTLLSSSGGYQENTYPDYGKGDPVPFPQPVTEFYAYAQYNVRFDNLMAAQVFAGMGSSSLEGPASSVPEPTSIGLLGCAGLMLGRRSRQS